MSGYPLPGGTMPCRCLRSFSVNNVADHPYTTAIVKKPKQNIVIDSDVGHHVAFRHLLDGPVYRVLQIRV
jgi:hypothetical protein